MDVKLQLWFSQFQSKGTFGVIALMCTFRYRDVIMRRDKCCLCFIMYCFLNNT